MREEQWDGETGKEEAERFSVLKIKEPNQTMWIIQMDHDDYDFSKLPTVCLSRDSFQERPMCSMSATWGQQSTGRL